MTLRSILNFILILCSIGMQGQYVYFNNLYSTDHPETTTAVEVMPDGYVTATAQNNDGERVVLMRKYDWNGIEILSNGIVIDTCYFYVHGHAALKKASDSTLIYSGLFETNDEVYTRIFLFNNELDTIWSTKLNIPDMPLVDMTVVEVLEDGYLFFGYVQYEIDRDILCVKLNLDGEYQWHWVLEDATKSNTPFNIYKLSESEFLVGGVVINAQSFQNSWITRIDIEGNLVWYHELGFSAMNDGGLGTFARMSNGDFVAATSYGVSGEPLWPDMELRTIEFDENNNWNNLTEQIYSTFWRHGASKVLVSQNDSRLIQAAYFDEQDDVHTYLQKINSDGSEVWMNFYAYDDCSTCSNALGDIEFAPDSGYICTGYFIDYSDEIPINKTWLLKIDACGDVQYNGCPPSVNVQEETQNDSGISIWPNPARETLHLNADPGIEITSLRLFDLTGALVIENHLRHFTGSYSVDVSSLPGGYYFAEITDGKGNRQVFKLVME